MIIGLTLPVFTLLQVVLSLIGIGAGIIVCIVLCVLGIIAVRRYHTPEAARAAAHCGRDPSSTSSAWR